MQRMDSPAFCGTSCAMPTADESNHSAAGTTHPHNYSTRAYPWALTLDPDEFPRLFALLLKLVPTAAYALLNYSDAANNK